MASPQHADLADPVAPCLEATLSDLPDEVLGLCLARGLSSPRDLAPVLLTSRRFHIVGKQAPLLLRLVDDAHPPGSCTPADARRRVQGALTCFPGAVGVDASGCPLDDEGVTELVEKLPRLGLLLLNGCKKVTDGAAARSLFPASTSAGAGQPAAPLRAVLMQRCFQLTPAALSAALLAGMRNGSALEALALSHLNLRQWPDCAVMAVLEARSARSMGQAGALGVVLPDDAGAPGQPGSSRELTGEARASLAEPPVVGVPGAEQEQRLAAASCQGLPGGLAQLTLGATRGLRLLALHNCSGVTLGALRTLAMGCPALVGLFLGGSSLALQEAEQLATTLLAVGGSAAAAEEEEEGEQGSEVGAGSSQLLPGSRVGSVGLAGIELVPGWALPDEVLDCDGGMHSVQAARHAAAAALGRLGIARLADPLVLAAAAELATVAFLLPRLQALELSFALPGLVPLLQELLGPSEASSGGGGGNGGSREQGELGGWFRMGRGPVQVWDLCHPESVRQALAWRRRAAADALELPPDVPAFLRAAANCSSGAKTTPLHVAVDEGRCGMMQDLLSLGADVQARDRSGASPLFRACEIGRAALLPALLGAGANLTQRNSAGEAPLYIASLRGHWDVVAALLEHCRAAGVGWEDPELYGDAWTPLMAAAVGGHHAIAAQLLEAAGPELAPGLVQATNRYGQTAVHIAARRGSFDLVRCLVEAGGGAKVVGLVDDNGRTAAEVARRNGNTPAWELLRAFTASTSRSEAEESRGGRRGKRGKKAAGGAGAAFGPTLQPPSAAGNAAASGPPLSPTSLPSCNLAQQPACGRQWVGRRLGARKSEAANQ